MFPDDVVVVDDDGAVLIPQALLDEVVASRRRAGARWRPGSWARSRRAPSLPGLYPPNAENKARYEASRKKG